MTNGWQEVSLKEFAKPISRSVSVEAGTEYRTIGVKWWGMGAYERDTIDGSRTAAKTLSIVREGDLIINKIWVRHGSVAIASKDVDGCAGSGEFPTFELDLNRIEPRWIHWQTKMRSFWGKCDSLSRGTSGKNRIKPELFLTIKIPLPSLNEQRRILERIEDFATHIANAQSLRDKSDKETEIISLAIRNISFDSHQEYKRKKLDNLCTIVRGSSPRPKGDIRFYGGNVPRLLIADISRDGKYVTPKIDSLTEEGAKLSRPMPKGSLVIAISGSYGVPAFLAVDACIHDGFIGFRDIDSSIDPEYLYQVLLLSKPYFDSVVKDSGLKNLTTSHLKNLDIPVPPLDEQRRIVAYLDSVQARLASLRELQSATGEELSALLPSVLDKAFKGEL